MSIRPEVRSHAAYSYKAPPPHEVKLDQNESPYDLPEWLKTRAFERLADVEFNRYPAMLAEPLKQILADLEGWSEEGLVVAGGSNILIQAAVAACAINRRVVTLRPTFPVYAIQARLLGADLSELPLEAGFELPVDSLLERLEQGEGVLFLANPASPTGNLHGEAELDTILQAAAHGWTVVLDEAYHQFAGSDLSHFARRYPHVASLRTFSKSFGLAGVRLGYLLAGSELASNVAKLLLPFSVSAVQVAVALSVLEAPEVARHYVEEVQRERPRIERTLAALPGVTAYSSRTNFVLFRVGDAATWHQELIRRGVLVRRQDALSGLEGCLRVTVGKPSENDLFLSAMREIAGSQAVEATSG